MEDFMTTVEAAKTMNVSITTVSRLINRGILKGQKFGPVWMVDRDSVQDYLERNEGKAKNDPTRGRAND
jgi:excisionase family DNA binding protein